MRFRALATDYDNTIALHGVVSATVQDALAAVKRSGRKLLLVTGRTAAELDAVFDPRSLFDAVVLENGALLEGPQGERLLARAIPEGFVAELRRRDVTPLAVGQAIVSTAEPNAEQVQAVIEAQGLDLTLHYNRDSLMVLPPGVDKVGGLTAAIEELGMTMDSVVAMGDGENDCAMLTVAGAGVAVENALDQVKSCADIVLDRPGTDGIRALTGSLVDRDLADLMGTPLGR